MGIVPLPTYLWCVLGIVISVLLPILTALLPKPLGKTLAAGVMPEIRPYLVTGLFGIVAAIVVIAAAGDGARTWSHAQALIAGYSWDSTLQKLRRLY
jgi:UDP-N-acetylglucosamine:LPS N-acetylglucosamine transferase